MMSVVEWIAPGPKLRVGRGLFRNARRMTAVAIPSRPHDRRRRRPCRTARLATAGCETSPKRSPRRSPTRTKSSSRCPTSAPRNGIGRTPRGSSRRSCSRPDARRGTTRSIPTYAYLFNSYYEAVGPRHPRAATRAAVAPVGRRGRALPRARRRRDARADRRVRRRRGRARIRLGLHHEQQHQELLLMDIKHVLHCNPTDPVVRRDATRRAASPRRPVDFAIVHGGNVEIGHDDGPAVLVRQRAPAPRRAPRADAHRRPARLRGRVARVHRRRRLPTGPSCGSPTAGTRCRSNGWDAPLYWRDDGADGWSVFTLGGRRPLDPERTGRARQPLRGRRVTRAGAARACPPSSSGSTRSRCSPPGSAAARSTTSPGSGRRARTCPTRASARRPARSVSTTASS